ncbi:MAG: helix-hairpin-helix domain-containing protein [Pseudomonadota bacterium]
MSLYRRLIVAVAALGLATSVFAADENAPTTTTTTTDTTATAPTTETTPGPTAETTKEDTTTTTTTTTTASTDKVDINKATVKELMKVKGLSAAKAKAIVLFRKKHGDFKSIDDLKDVKGFKKLSDKKFQELQDRLTAG